MTLTREDVAHIADLARLTLPDAAIARYRDDLAVILEHAARLAAVDTEGVPPTDGLHAPHAPLRADTPTAPLSQEAALRNAPETEAGYVIVPPLI